MTRRHRDRRDRRRIRFRFYVNQRLMHQSDMTPDEASRAQETGEIMLRPADLWVMVFEDLSGEKPPWFYGNDEVLGKKLARDLFPGMKLPEGEMGWQKRNGVRVPPESLVPEVEYGLN